MRTNTQQTEPPRLLKTILLSLLLLPLAAMAKPQKNWIDFADTDWYYADTSASVFTITTAEQLAGLAKLTDDYVTFFYDKTIKLGNDIALNDTTDLENWESNPPEYEWTVIAKNDAAYVNGEPYFYYRSFVGTFDGNGYIISGLYINTEESFRTTYNIYGTLYEVDAFAQTTGLFGTLKGEIKNLGLTGFYIKGLGIAGGLIGSNSVDFDGEEITAIGTINNCYAIGTITGVDEGIGGLVGVNIGIINNSYFIGSVSGAYKDVGGLVGFNSNEFYVLLPRDSRLGIITDSYSTGTVTNITSIYSNFHFGGLVGYNDGGIISNCYSASTVANSYSSQMISHFGGLAGINTGSISNCYATGSVIAQFVVGGLVGSNYSDTSEIINSYSTGSVTTTSDADAGGLAGSNDGRISGSYSTGSVAGAYINVGGLVGYNFYTGIISGSYSIGATTGLDNYVGGLVGENKGEISGSYSIGSVNGSRECTGGLAGRNSAENSVISSSFFKGSVQGGISMAGGLAGCNEGKVSNSYSASTVMPGSVYGYIAGLVGKNAAGGDITNSYSISNLVGLSGMEGLVADNSGTVTNSFYDKEIINRQSSVNFYNPRNEDKSTEEMKQIETFDEWDFDSIWEIDPTINKGYPHLRIFDYSKIPELCNEDEEEANGICVPKKTTISLPQIASGNIRAYAMNGSIVLQNVPQNARVEMYSLNGKRTYSGYSGNSQILKIPVQTKGMYIVKTGPQTFRIAVR